MLLKKVPSFVLKEEYLENIKYIGDYKLGFFLSLIPFTIGWVVAIYYNFPLYILPVLGVFSYISFLGWRKIKYCNEIIETYRDEKRLKEIEKLSLIEPPKLLPEKTVYTEMARDILKLVIKK